MLGLSTHDDKPISSVYLTINPWNYCPLFFYDYMMFIVDLCDMFTHILQDCFIGNWQSQHRTSAIEAILQEMGKIDLLKYNITVTSQWARSRLKSPVSWSFAQPFIEAELKKTSKFRVTGLCEEKSPHKGPVTRKMFPFDDVITSRLGSCAFFLGRAVQMILFSFNETTLCNVTLCHMWRNYQGQTRDDTTEGGVIIWVFTTNA